MRLTRVKCWPVASARAWPVSPPTCVGDAAGRRFPARLGDGLLRSVFTKRRGQVPDGFERLLAVSHGLRVLVISKEVLVPLPA